MTDWLQWTAIVCSGIAAAVSFTWFAKSKNKGHLFLACCFLVAAVAQFAAVWIRHY